MGNGNCEERDDRSLILCSHGVLNFFLRASPARLCFTLSGTEGEETIWDMALLSAP
jgi:hypothetical protein